MFLPTNLNFSNKYFFVNYLRFVFSNYNFLLFFNILNYSNSFFNSFRLLRYTNFLNPCVLNSKVLKVVLKRSINVDFFPGVYMVLYSNNLNDIIFFLTDLRFKFSNFIPFSLLFKKHFIFFDSSSLNYFLMCSKNSDKLILFYILFNIYFLIFSYFLNYMKNSYYLMQKVKNLL